MRAMVLVGFLGLAMGGCLDGGAPVTPTVEASFEAYRDCSGALEAWPTRAHCDTEESGTPVSADWQAEVPDGWACTQASDPTGHFPDAPRWRIYTRPPPDDLAQALVPTRLQVALAYDVTALGTGPVDGVAQVFSHEGPLWGWTNAGPRGFVILGEFGAHDEIEVEGVVTDLVRPGAPPDPEPSAMWDATFTNESTFTASGVAAEYVGTAWGRHPSSTGWYPRLQPTQLVRLADGLRYLPAFEFPIHGGPDPKTQQGSGHWSTNMHAFALWTDVADGNATIQLNQAELLRFDLHLTDLGSGLCEVCPSPLEDPAGVVTCILPVPPRTGSPLPTKP